MAGALAAGATLGGLALGSASDAPAAPAPMRTEFVDVPTIIAPLFADGEVMAYALVKVGMEVDARALGATTVPLPALLADATHTMVMTGGMVIGPDGPDPDELREALRAAADDALGGGAIRTFVTRLNVLPKEEVRGGSRARRIAGPS